MANPNPTALGNNRPVGRPKGSKNKITETLQRTITEYNCDEEIALVIKNIIQNDLTDYNPKDKIAFLNWFTKTFVITADKQADISIAETQQFNKDDLKELINGHIRNEESV